MGKELELESEDLILTPSIILGLKWPFPSKTQGNNPPPSYSSVFHKKANELMGVNMLCRLRSVLQM